MERLSSMLNGTILPFLIVLCGIILSHKIKLFKILTPKHFLKDLSEASIDKKSSPFKSMCTALAGTLGVGNIAGVGSAIASGGAGAVFWMWVGAIFSMSVKYAEVSLAVKYRENSNKNRYIGGTMFTMKNALSKYCGKRSAYCLGAVFAILCITNSFVMGNVIQSNAAGAVFEGHNSTVGFYLSIGLIVTAIIGLNKISSITYYLIPPLSIIYIILSLAIILRNFQILPDIIYSIFKCAFSKQAFVGGLYGHGIREAIRFGITRGIFSNEAGCGTSPSAHATANVRSPHHQGCFGIFEVIADTLVLCSMTAFVILIADKTNGVSTSNNGILISLNAFGNILGIGAYYLIGISVILFAFATIIAQIYYGDVAITYFTKSKIPKVIFIVISAVLCYMGTTLEQNDIWLFADIIVGIMSTINTSILLLLRNQIKELSYKRK